MNKSILMLLLGLITIWDTFTTVYGTHLIFGDGFVQMAASIGFSLILTGFLLRTIPIIKNPSDDLIPAGAKILWFIAIGYDVFTSFTGNMDLILGNASGTQKVILAIGLTIFVCSAPIGLSKLYFQPED